MCWKLLQVLLIGLATQLLPLRLAFTAKTNYGSQLPYWQWIWGNFDGAHYMSIAMNGYEQFKEPFFPLYPIIIRTIHLVFNLNILVTGSIVSHFCFFLTLPLLYALTRKDGQKNWMFFLLVLLLFPTSFFYGSVYNDALFFLLATLSIFSARNKLWLLAGIVGAAATLTRLNGLVLAIYIVVEYFTSQESIKNSWDLRRLVVRVREQLQFKELWQSGVYAVFLIPAAFIGYLSYIQWRFGNWRLLFSAMDIWKQSKLTFPLAVFWRYFKILSSCSPHQLNYWVALLEIMAVLLYCQICLLSIKKIRFSYWVFMVISIILPSLTGTFAGMPRYALHLYPFFLAASMLLYSKPRWFKLLYFNCLIAIMIFVITLFTRGYFVS